MAGTLRLVLCPLVPQPPGFGAVLVAMPRAPQVGTQQAGQMAVGCDHIPGVVSISCVLGHGRRHQVGMVGKQGSDPGARQPRTDSVWLACIAGRTCLNIATCSRLPKKLCVLVFALAGGVRFRPGRAGRRRERRAGPPPGLLPAAPHPGRGGHRTGAWKYWAGVGSCSSGTWCSICTGYNNAAALLMFGSCWQCATHVRVYPGPAAGRPASYDTRCPAHRTPCLHPFPTIRHAATSKPRYPTRHTPHLRLHSSAGVAKRVLIPVLPEGNSPC